MSVGSKIGWRLPGLRLLKDDTVVIDPHIRNSHLLEWLTVKGLVALNGKVLKTNRAEDFSRHECTRPSELLRLARCLLRAAFRLIYAFVGFFLTERILSHAFFLWKSVFQYLALKWPVQQRFVFKLSEVNENQWLDFSSEISWCRRLYSVAPFNVLYLQPLLNGPEIHFRAEMCQKYTKNEFLS